jgi:hypothetical protein
MVMGIQMKCRFRMVATLPAMAALLATVVFTIGCAERGTKEMITVPAGRQTEEAGSEPRAMVMFRVAMDLDGQAVEAPLSAFRSMSLLTNVAPAGVALTAGRGFLPGGLDLESHRAGWAFLALPAGRYQLAFEGVSVRFDTPGAELRITAGAPIGLSSTATIVVPPDARLIYIGTFALTCHKLRAKRGAPEAACATLEVRDELDLARQVAQSSFSNYGSVLKVLASVSEARRVAVYP